MRLSIIIVSTLAVSVILSSTATWGLTYSTSYDELRDMSSGFAGMATSSVDEFRKLVLQLISDSSTLVSNLLNAEYNRSLSQINQTEQELLQTTLDLMAQTENATAQSQRLVSSLVVSFGGFMQTAIAEFRAVGTADAARLRRESASRAKLIFGDMLQSSALAIKRMARLYNMGMANLSWSVDQPVDDGVCSLMGSLCDASAEEGVQLYIGTIGAATLTCDPVNGASNLLLRRGPVVDAYTYVDWPAFDSSSPGANFAAWKQSCLAANQTDNASSACRHGTGMQFPARCNATCGYDPRCRPWYTIQSTSTAPKTRMSDVYLDSDTGKPVVSLSYPIFSSSSQLLAVTATDFFLSDVDTYLGALSASQLVAVVFNTSDLLVMGASRVCPGSGGSPSGSPIAATCDPALQALGGWLRSNRNLAGNASLELAGFLWDVFPATVDAFSYFVVVGMNETELYAVVTATSQAANDTLQTLSQQQSNRMAESEAASMARMAQLSIQRILSLRSMEAQYKQYMQQQYTDMDATFDASRQQSASNLSFLTSSEMHAIDDLEDYHLSKVKNSIGVTFGAVVGIFAGVLLCATYGTWAVTKQVQHIAQVIEDVAHMHVEHLEVTQKSSIREVRRIEAALGVLAARLAEYKSYMPAGLFQPEDENPLADPAAEPLAASPPVPRKRSFASAQSPPSPHRARTQSVVSQSLDFLRPNARPAVSAGGTRLLRRSAAAMAVNVVRFQTEAAQRSTAQLEGLMNRLIAVVHGLACKGQGNIDAIVGDQILVTFNAHFACSDPSTAASTAALEVVATLKAEAAFPWRIQVGLAAGAMYAGHLGTTAFKSMVALGAPLKVASLLAHFSGADAPPVLVCPSLEERIKYSFNLQPVDLVALPFLGEHIPLYSKSIIVYALLDNKCHCAGSREWLYEVGAGHGSCHWTATFTEVRKAASLEKAAEDLQRYVADHPEDRLAERLLRRLPQWQPRVGIVLAERPDLPRALLDGDSGSFKAASRAV